MPREEVDNLRYQPQPDDLPPSDFDAEMMYVKVRYKDPDGAKSKLLAHAVADRPGSASIDFRFATAVAGFGMLLRDSEHARDLTLDEVVRLAEKGKGDDPRGYRGGVCSAGRGDAGPRAAEGGDRRGQEQQPRRLTGPDN